MRRNRLQKILIGLGIVVTLLLSLFFYREIFPEYKGYQEAYMTLEKLRSEQTGRPPPPFKVGIKQIVLENKERGPVQVDRCITCHVALEFEHFSPKSDDYVWNLVPENSPLRVYEPALQMHPLIGKETRPFELHPIDEYGCVSCHNGNGQAIGFERAHGPVWDGHYEATWMGPVPVFLEVDSINDPAFSKAFNHKPGHELLFQVNPIFVGGLIEAKCVQCHTQTEETPPVLNHYLEGKKHFIAQACYACHKIAGVARGGVGPELTHASETYPWFLKESIVWPQADLPTSTMPNFHLDHDEVENLMTYLLSQTGRRKSQSEYDYQLEILEWEDGKRPNTFEKPIEGTKIRDVAYGMEVFASEGCAACHRLKGYTSSVGLAIEKNSPSFETLLEERAWFQSLIPEEITPLDLVSVLETQGDTIDKKIIAGVHPEGLLEKIEAEHPGLIQSFYPSFTFAHRAKNHLPEEKDAWQERVHRVMLQFVQEYGLGRQIGPKTNWSGIYRSDQWLIEHFWRPSAHAARSIMPVFPFDESKFYALTYMLNVLGRQNRDAVRRIWDAKGFDPKEAYGLFCAQCHGSQLLGNGPIAEWIYPVPKNLRNADFLRNYTKENVINSILHGVKGGPMAPWGETPNGDEPPVITEEEAVLLTEWMFAPLIGEEVVPKEGVIPKWAYTAEDVLKEMEDEGILLRDREVFDVRETDGQKSFYINQKLYTQKNLTEGQALYEEHCATCHGREGDGMGDRTATMLRAKPRMLINLDWLNTQNDLKMLRSIKYGVLGTSMPAWGDQTTSWQRLLLVMYIHQLSEKQAANALVEDALYQRFNQHYPTLLFEEKKDALKQLKEQRLQFALMGRAFISHNLTMIPLFVDLIKGDKKAYFSLISQEKEQLKNIEKEIEMLKIKIPSPEILEKIEEKEREKKNIQEVIKLLNQVHAL